MEMSKIKDVKIEVESCKDGVSLSFYGTTVDILNAWSMVMKSFVDDDMISPATALGLLFSVQRDILESALSIGGDDNDDLQIDSFYL